MTLRTDAADATWEHRYDRGELRAAHRREDGTLFCSGFACREGVLEYRRADGSIRRELVPLETLKASAAGLARLTVTTPHPVREDGSPDEVTPENFGKYGVGDTDNRVIVGDGGYTEVHLAVRRVDGLEAIDAGTHELSPGYRARIDNRAGVHPVYGPYDAVQVERHYNHLAIVPKARGGSTVRLRADSAAATTLIARTDSGGTSAPTTTPGPAAPHGGRVKPIIVQLVAAYGLTGRYDSDDQALEAIGAEVKRRNDEAAKAEQQRADAATKAQGEHKAALDKLTGERDAATARADKAEGELKKVRDEEQARADKAERAELEGLAKRLGVDPASHTDGKALRKAIAAAHMGGTLKADASDVYVEAVVDMARRDHPDGSPSDDGGRADSQAAWESLPAPAGGQPRNDGGNRQGQQRKPLGARMRDLYSSAGREADTSGRK